MCVRYLRPDKLAEVEALVALLGVKVFRVRPQALVERMTSAEVSPGVTAPLVGQGGILCEGVWGFTKWDGKGLVFNARCETLATSPFFAPHLGRGRCVVPATGYFEWEHGAGGKPTGRRFCIRAARGGMLWLAGVARRAPQGALEYTVVTCPPREEVRGLHDRMPLLLTAEGCQSWLAAETVAAVPTETAVPLNVMEG